MKVTVPESPLDGLGVPVGLVTAEPPTTSGLVTVRVKALVQLFPPEAMVQEVVGPGVRVPDITGAAEVVNEELTEYPVPVVLVA